MRWRTAVTGSLAGAGLYLGVATGRVSVDLGVGRRKRALGPIELDVAAPRGVVFDVISEPYRGRTPRAMAGKLRVIERGSDLVLAEHMTPIGAGLTAITVETVRFVPPERVEFRLVRGPVPGPPARRTRAPTPHPTNPRYMRPVAARTLPCPRPRRACRH